MKNKIMKILCIAIVCVLLIGATTVISCDWEEIGGNTAYFYPEETSYDLEGTPVENTGECSYGIAFDPKEYSTVKLVSDIMMREGTVEYIILEDSNENMIKEWKAPNASFEEELDEETFQKMAWITYQGSKASEGVATVTIYGKPKLITKIKRKIAYIFGD